MGPSVKFVSCFNGSFSKKKIMGNFFIRKKTKPGGGGGGGGAGGRGKFGKRPHFLHDFFWQPPLNKLPKMFIDYTRSL